MKPSIENNFLASMPGLTLNRAENTGLTELAAKTSDSTAFLDIGAQVLDNSINMSDI